MGSCPLPLYLVIGYVPNSHTIIVSFNYIVLEVIRIEQFHFLLTMDYRQLKVPPDHHDPYSVMMLSFLTALSR